jgi:predicted DNA-binding transcriptional regulator AlpA
MNEKAFLSDKELAARYGVIRPTVWRWVSEGRLPAPVRLGPNTTRWRLIDIEEHEAALEPAVCARRPATPAPR